MNLDGSRKRPLQTYFFKNYKDIMHKYILTLSILLYSALSILLYSILSLASDQLGIAIGKDIIPGTNTVRAILDQDAIDGFIEDGKEIIFTEKIETVKSATAPGTVRKVTEKIKVVGPIQSITEIDDPFISVMPRIRLGTSGKNTRDYRIVGWQIQQQLSDIYDINILPAKSSVINLAGIRDNHLDWAIINADALLYFPDLQIEILASLDPAYAHLIIQRMNNDDIEDLDNIGPSDMMAVGDKNSDAYITWSILKANVNQYAKIPTLKHDGYRALASTKMRLSQGFFRICDKQDPIIMKANNEVSLKMININNPKIYNLSVRGYPMYTNVTMNADMYDTLLSDDDADTMEITKILITSKKWFDANPEVYDNIMMHIEQALANAQMGVRAN